MSGRVDKNLIKIQSIYRIDFKLDARQRSCRFKVNSELATSEHASRVNHNFEVVPFFHLLYFLKNLFVFVAS